MSTLEKGQVLAARYALVRRLAARDATELWEARDDASGEARLLKLVVPGRADSDAAHRRLLHGGRIQLGLRHPHLVPCEQVDPGPPAFAVYPYYARGDLSALRGRPASEVLPVLAGVADGMAALHRGERTTAEEQLRIFDKFYEVGDASQHFTSRTRFGGKGVGLGLALVKGIVEAHGGMVWVDSPGASPQTPGGSAFHILLPLKQETEDNDDVCNPGLSCHPPA
jgi:hypothetical protein